MTILAKTKGKRGEIYVYEAIGDGWFGGITAKSFADTLATLKDVTALDIYINSPGGGVFDGIAIYNQIRRWDRGERIVHIDGIAASIASVIAMAGDEIRIAANGQVMIHEPWGMAYGTADDMRKSAESLDGVHETILDTYVSRTKGDRKELDKLMRAETWMLADEAVRRGFATSKTEEKTPEMEPAAMAATMALLDKFKNTPASLRNTSVAANAKVARMSMRVQQLRAGASPRNA